MGVRAFFDFGVLALFGVDGYSNENEDVASYGME
jgi:hypothetical protein